MQSVYTYYDASGIQRSAEVDDFNFTGTWTSTGTYFTASRDTVTFGSSIYTCITNNIGVIPTSNKTEWSPLILRTPIQTSSILNLTASGSFVGDVNSTVMSYVPTTTGLFQLLIETTTVVPDSNGTLGTADVYYTNENGTEAFSLGCIIGADLTIIGQSAPLVFRAVAGKPIRVVMFYSGSDGKISVIWQAMLQKLI